MPLWPPTPHTISRPATPIAANDFFDFQYRFMPPVGFVLPAQDRNAPILLATEMRDLRQRH
jgi:hypothetical protein